LKPNADLIFSPPFSKKAFLILGLFPNSHSRVRPGPSDVLDDSAPEPSRRILCTPHLSHALGFSHPIGYTFFRRFDEEDSLPPFIQLFFMITIGIRSFSIPPMSGPWVEEPPVIPPFILGGNVPLRNVQASRPFGRVLPENSSARR